MIRDPAATAPSQRRPNRIRDIRSIALYLLGGVILTYLTAWACDRLIGKGPRQPSHAPLLGASDAWEAELVVLDGQARLNDVSEGFGCNQRSSVVPLYWSESQNRLVWTKANRDDYLSGDYKKSRSLAAYTDVAFVKYEAGWPFLAVYSLTTMHEQTESLGITRVSAIFPQGSTEHAWAVRREERARRDAESLRRFNLLRLPVVLRKFVANQHKAIFVSIHPLWPGFALNTLFWGGLLLVLFRSPRWIRTFNRRRTGQCITCGYTLAGLTQCPECGTIVRVPAPHVSESQA